MSADNSLEVPVYINNKLDQIKLNNDRSNVQQQINSLQVLLQTNPQKSVNTTALKSQLNKIDADIKSLIEKAIVSRQKIAEVYRDELYASFLDSQIAAVSIGQARNGNRPAIVDRIRRAANSDWDVRQETGGLPISRRLEVSANRIKAKHYLEKMTEQWAERKELKAELLEQNAATEEEQEKIRAEKEKAIAEKLLARTKIDEYYEDEVRKGIESEVPLPSDKKTDNKDQVKKIQQLKAEGGFQAPAINQPEDQPPPKEPTYVPVLVDSPEIVGTANNLVAIVADPLAGINYSRTQKIIFEGVEDQFDPREVEIIIPASYNSPAPAYIQVFNFTGDIGVLYNDTEVEQNKIQKDRLPTLENIFRPNSKLAYNQFSVRTVNQNYGEKFQIDETLGEGLAIFGFGKKPKIWQIQGTLLNDLVSKWKSKFEIAFDQHFRLSILIRKNSYAKITIPASSVQIDCYPVQLDIVTDVSSESLSMFTLSVIVRDYYPMTKLAITPSMQKILSKLTSMMTKSSDAYNYIPSGNVVGA